MSFEDVQEVQRKLRQLDIVFVVDTTGSMEPSTREAQKRLTGFVRALAQTDMSPSVAFGIVAYRDHPPEDTTYVTRVYPLVEKVELAQQNINGLTASGGGDGPEAVLDGLYAALNAIKWRDYAHKVILLVGDAPPHGAGESGDRWPKGCPCGLTTEEVIAHSEGIGAIIHAVGVGAHKTMTQSFRQIASRTGGEFVPLGRVDALIDRILGLLRSELGKVAVDIDVFGAWATATDKSATGLAEMLGKPVPEVDQSLKRLKGKGIPVPDARTMESFRGMIERIDAGTAAATEIDVELLDRIVIDEGSDYTGSADDNDFEIRILDE